MMNLKGFGSAQGLSTVQVSSGQPVSTLRFELGLSAPSNSVATTDQPSLSTSLRTMELNYFNLHIHLCNVKMLSMT
jgi:hypothetical protein